MKAGSTGRCATLTRSMTRLATLGVPRTAQFTSVVLGSREGTPSTLNTTVSWFGALVIWSHTIYNPGQGCLVLWTFVFLT